MPCSGIVLSCGEWSAVWSVHIYHERYASATILTVMHNF